MPSLVPVSARKINDNNQTARPRASLQQRMTSVKLDSPTTHAHAGIKREEPDSASFAVEVQSPSPKRARTSPTPSDEDSLTQAAGSTSHFPAPSTRRTSAITVHPSVSSFQAASTMLHRAEDSGGSRTIKMARGIPQSPSIARSSPRPGSRQTSEAGSTSRNWTRHMNAGLQALESVGLAEFLQQDERPIFAIDLEQNLPDGLPIIFMNQALRNRVGLCDSILGRGEHAALLLDVGATFADFRSWLLTEHDLHAMSMSFPFGGVLWKTSTIRKKFRVVTGSQEHAQPPGHAVIDFNHDQRPMLKTFRGLGSSSSSQHTITRMEPGYFDLSPDRGSNLPKTLEGLMTAGDDETEDPESPFENESSLDPPTSIGDAKLEDLLSKPIAPEHHLGSRFVPAPSNPEGLQPMSMEYLADRGFFDWTRLPLSANLPDHIRFARNFDWSQTSLGPIEEWSADLRAMCNLIMASPHPAAMYWGPEHVAIYNEPYTMLAGNKHPSLMGSRYQDAWVEIWDAIVEVFRVAMEHAQSTMKDDDCLFITRNGFLEETYFSWSVIPLIGDDGSVVGIYNPAFEKTRRKIAERRMLTLREIGEQTAAARAISEFWSLLVQGFKYNEYDAPLVIIYSLNETDDSDVMSSASSTAAALKQCRLEGTLGIQPGHPAAPEFIDLKNDGKGFGPAFKKAISSEKPVVLCTDDGTLDESLLEGIEWRGFGDPSKIIVVSPIRPTTGESTLGFLVMGTNPRRPYDEDYDLFVQLLGRQLATSIASVVLFEDEIRKGEDAARIAAQDRIELSNQLAERTQAAAESENKFTRMAEIAPVGMYIGDATGAITFANDAWYKLSGWQQGKTIGHSWISTVKDEDRERAWLSWSAMLKKKTPIQFEFRFTTMWKDKFGNTSNTWVLASASPERDDDGNIIAVFGTVTDISSQKAAEESQRKRMEEAVERKRQQERYIDTTSHEMRNPLSAILQSADSISSSLIEFKTIERLNQSQIETIETAIESSQTITLCAQHQKRIVDDVLTLSKLDSAMLLVTPVDVQPSVIARRAVKMFESELQTADIGLEVRIDKSYQDLAVDWVRLDPTRLSQVLINLMTNAIKFTTTQHKRKIRMHLAASREKPSAEDKWKLTYIKSKTHKDKDVTAGGEWGLGEHIYIHFAVQDTGRGLNDEEREKLFQRFSQANPKTHVTYGGSGLGLFISRELVEMQGGEIGVASEAGKGSTFAFYVKGRRSQGLPNGSEDNVDVTNTKEDNKASSASKDKHEISSKPNPPQTASAGPSDNSVLSDLGSSQRSMATSAGKSEPVNLRVLIVEDNLINQRVLAQQLKKVGCTVTVANHGGEAIEVIKSSFFYIPTVTAGQRNGKDPKEIDVVLMDLEMPVMDGMTCARTLRQMQSAGQISRHIPIIAVTANAREEQINDAMGAGMDDVVSKPFRIPDLIPKMYSTIARFTGEAGVIKQRHDLR